MSMINAMFSLVKGKAKATSLNEQAATEIFEAGNERIKGLRSENEFTDQMFDVVAGQQIAMVANGIDPSSPGAVRIQEKTIKKGEAELSKIRTDTILRDQRRRQRARGLKKAAKLAKIAGIVGAVSEIQKSAQAAASRGTGGGV